MNTKTTFPLPVEHVVIGHFEGEAPVTRIILATDDDQASESLEALVRQETGEDYENVEFHIDTVSLVSIVCANPLTYYGHTIDRKSMFIATVHAENDSATRLPLPPMVRIWPTCASIIICAKITFILTACHRCHQCQPRNAA